MSRRVLRGMIVLTMVAAICAPARQAAANECAAAFNRITSAFIRRLARDTGNVLSRDGANAPLIGAMTLGVPTGTAAARRLDDKARRLWIHTENKIHRKCSDTEAASVYPGPGRTTAEVTDDLFNAYGLPWVAALRDLAAPFGADCVRTALVQSGYAARDQLRSGRYNWAQYEGRAARYCPPAVVAQLDDTAAAHLLPDLGSAALLP